VSLYIDFTEFLHNPITTGIQRIEGEICKHLPRDAAIPVRFNSNHYVALSQDVIQAIGSYFRNAVDDARDEIYRLGDVKGGNRVRLSQRDVLLVPEVFLDVPRLDFFDAKTDNELENYRFIVYDLLPITNPEFFWSHWSVPFHSYFRTLRRAAHCGFISESTQLAYCKRLKRKSALEGVVLPLGSDSLGPKASNTHRPRSFAFTVVGTIEPRKNHKLILDAFEPLLGRIDGLTLEFVGKIGWVDPGFASRLNALASDSNSGLRLIAARDDQEVRRRIEESRATIYVSAAEGYGLPPVESLWLGTPVIASASIPSLKQIGSSGIHYVEPLTVDNLRDAVLAFLDDRYADEKAREAIRANLPTWQSFVDEVMRWSSLGIRDSTSHVSTFLSSPVPSVIRVSTYTGQCS
jgi:glycosyltransferase involved in cell wall biosynthesis